MSAVSCTKSTCCPLCNLLCAMSIWLCSWALIASVICSVLQHLFLSYSLPWSAGNLSSCFGVKQLISFILSCPVSSQSWNSGREIYAWRDATGLFGWQCAQSSHGSAPGPLVCICCFAFLLFNCSYQGSGVLTGHLVHSVSKCCAWAESCTSVLL